MRMEIPHATCYFVNRDAGCDPHTVEGAHEIWDAFDRASMVSGELKSEDWILEERSELSEEFVRNTWSLTADLPEYADFVKIETDRGIIRFYGSATTNAHMTLGRLAEQLAGSGWERFDDYADARMAKNRRRLRQHARSKSTIESAAGNVHLYRRRATLHAANTAVRESFGIFRNLMALGFALSVFVGTEALRPTVIAGTIGSLFCAAVIFTFERSLSLARKQTT